MNCKNVMLMFTIPFSHGDSSNVDLDDFLSQLKVLKMTLGDEFISTIEILEFVKIAYCHPNV